MQAQDIVDWARDRMAVYKAPRIVEFMDALPKSGTGKILWRELQEQQRALHGSHPNDRDPVASSAAAAAVVTLDRPGAPATRSTRALKEGLAAAHRAGRSATASVRAVVLTGANGAFCAGGDLRGIAAAGALEGDGLRARMQGRARTVPRALIRWTAR